jgi:hypothetical protein
MKKMHNDFAPPRQSVPHLPDRVNWAILRAMSADPDKRPATCREFIEDLTGRSTRKDQRDGSGVMPAPDVWYLVHTDEEGNTHTVKGGLAAIRHCLREGLMGDATNVRVARSKAGPFDPIRSVPEFRDLVIAPGALPLAKGASDVPGATPIVTTVSTSAAVSPAKTPLPRSIAEPPPVRRPPPPTPTPLPVYRTPAIDVGQAKSSSGFDWITWLIAISLASAAFLLCLLLIRKW